MAEIIPFFPLKLVVFPGEQLNLHVFEERYKHLVRDIQAGDGIFGICVYLDKIMPIGTEMKLTGVVKTYEDGRMDINTVALRTFDILTFDNPIPGSLYAGGSVRFLENDPNASVDLKSEFLEHLGQLFDLMNYPVDLQIFPADSFAYAHKIGLKLEEEYALLVMEKEEHRLQFLIRHLIKVIAIMREIEAAKRRIKLNGHFKTLDPLDF